MIKDERNYLYMIKLQIIPFTIEITSIVLVSVIAPLLYSLISLVGIITLSFVSLLLIFVVVYICNTIIKSIKLTKVIYI